LSLPQLLLVDDSEAILAYEMAALTGHYGFSTATTGREALALAQQLVPDLVLLDLSMPGLTGDEVLRLMKADPALSHIPVIVISSEHERGEASTRAGAAAFLPKPIRAEQLRELVGQVLEGARRSVREGGLAVLPVGVGPLEFGLPLERVRRVLPQPATRPLPLGPTYLSELFEFDGQPVAVLDVARRLGIAHAVPRDERKLVVIAQDTLLLALSVDRVREPEELAASEIAWREPRKESGEGPIAEALLAVSRDVHGSLPIVDPRALLPRELLRELAKHLPFPLGPRLPSSEVEGSVFWVAEFTLAGERYALPLTTLRAAFPMRTLTPVPLAPPHVIGVLRHQGQILAALSLASLLGDLSWSRDPSMLLVVDPGWGELTVVDCGQIPTASALPLALVREAQAHSEAAVVDVTAPDQRRLHLIDLTRLLNRRITEARRAG
jgi:chemotaxis signal transduction protein/CheY-like chemotaxis protein